MKAIGRQDQRDNKAHRPQPFECHDPAADLWLSQEHSLYLDGFLVQAKHLLNGLTITQAEDVEAVECFHIEFDDHDVIVPDGGMVRLTQHRPGRSRPRDIRRLGVAVERLVLSDGDLSFEAWHSHAGLSDGFHLDEAGYRWTKGLALLPAALLRPFPDAVTLEVHLVSNKLARRPGGPLRCLAGSAAARDDLQRFTQTVSSGPNGC